MPQKALMSFFQCENYLVGGLNPSEKYEFVSWDDGIPNVWKVIKFHGSSHHQPVIINH